MNRYRAVNRVTVGHRLIKISDKSVRTLTQVIEITSRERLLGNGDGRNVKTTGARNRQKGRVTTAVYRDTTKESVETSIDPRDITAHHPNATTRTLREKYIHAISHVKTGDIKRRTTNK